MEDLKRFSEAIRVVERYELYLYQRAMGLALIVIGLIGPSAFFLILKSESFAVLFNISSTMFSIISLTLLTGIGIFIIIYLFASARILSSKRSGREDRRDLPFMILMFSIWFVAFFLAGYIPEPLSDSGWSIAGGTASLISYVLMTVSGHQKRPELIIIGVINILATLPIFLYGDILQTEIIVLTIFALSFILGGAYSVINANKYLEVG